MIRHVVPRVAIVVARTSGHGSLHSVGIENQTPHRRGWRDSVAPGAKEIAAIERGTRIWHGRGRAASGANPITRFARRAELPGRALRLRPRRYSTSDHQLRVGMDFREGHLAAVCPERERSPVSDAATGATTLLTTCALAETRRHDRQSWSEWVFGRDRCAGIATGSVILDVRSHDRGRDGSSRGRGPVRSPGWTTAACTCGSTSPAYDRLLTSLDMVRLVLRDLQLPCGPQPHRAVARPGSNPLSIR